LRLGYNSTLSIKRRKGLLPGKNPSLFIIYALVATVIFLTGCSERPPEAAKDPEFSAKLVSEYGDASQEYKVNFSGDKIRLEMVKPGTGVSIIRKDLGVIWTLMSDKKLFLEMAIIPQNKNPLVFMPDKILEYKKQAEETLDGRTLLKEKLVIQNEGEGQREFYRWFDPVLGWPVKAEALDGKWKLRLEDIKPGPQDPSLFEIPPDYRAIAPRRRSMPGGGHH
jgi:hypothetical protein